MRAPVCLLGALLAALPKALTSPASHTLWYPKPAEEDFFDALPIGNGRLGAMIHGFTDRELIILNEESIWSGGPLDKVPPTAQENLGHLREQILEGNLTEAGETWSQHFVPEYDDMRRYQPAGELRIDTGHALNGTTEYRRDLDISTGLTSVSYKHGGVLYTREAFGNFPHNVLGFKISVDTAGALNFSIALSREQNATKVFANVTDLSLGLYGVGEEDDTYRFASRARVILSDDGAVTANDTALHVTGATEAWVLWTAETAFRHPEATPEALQAIADETLGVAVDSGFVSLKTEAVDDYQQYYSRTTVNLGTSGDIGTQDTLQRIENWKRGSNITNDPELMTLHFNYGKYLLIQSSRPGTLPANLQGIWNRDFNPPWDSKFTLNINLEMNYWLAQPLAMPEITEPVVDMLDRIAETGADVASEMYGMEGWCCHHNTDITGDCTPYHGLTIAAPYPLGGAWVAFEAIEHFRFTGDLDFARDRTLPLLRGAMDFIYSWATQRDGWWITNPSCSPENSYVIPEGMSVAGEETGIDAGVMNDRAIMWEIMQGFIDISSALDLTDGVERATSFRDNIQPPVAGSYGQLLEYSQDYEENEAGHRHLSPLVCVQPGTWITPLKTPAHAEKAKILLDHRFESGGGGNSWAVAWASAMYARLFDSAAALRLAMEMDSRWAWNNLFTRNGGYFQIDGNSGFTAAVVEMFLQSHAGVVHLGPAIPTSVGLMEGSFTGWIARGGFRVDMTWEGGAVTGAEIEILKVWILRVRVGDGVAFLVDGEEVGEGGFETVAGQTYVITVE